MGGVWNGLSAAEPCSGADTAIDESEVYPYSAAFERSIHNVKTCPFNGQDSGWGQTISSSSCWSGSTTLTNGIETLGFRQMPFSGETMLSTGVCGSPWQEKVYARRDRSLVCPPNYQRLSVTTSTGTTQYCQLPAGSPDPAKNKSCPAAGKGNPCDPSLGNKYQTEVDLSNPGVGVPNFERHFNSIDQPTTPQVTTYALGNWSHTYDQKIKLTQNSLLSTATAYREGGKAYHFGMEGGQWVGNTDVADTLVATATGWTYTRPTGVVEVYDNIPDGAGTGVGKLLSVTDAQGLTQSFSYNELGLLSRVTGPRGHAIQLTYDANERISKLIAPNLSEITYLYDTARNLSRVNYPDGTAKLYHYENTSFPHHLTGISQVDAAGTATRYATYAYDASGRAISTEHAGGQEKFTLRYDSATQTTVTDAVGNQEVMPLPSTSASRTWSRNVIWPTTKYSPRPLTPTTT